MNKKLYTNIITNELEGSAFFPDRKNNPVPPVRVVPLVRPVLPVPPQGKRIMKQRHPFDIYQDQYESLQSLALEERKQGGVGSMSAMVREAIDKLLAERRSS
ncbi:hypothetical protein GCM10010347_33420 [Streptomyces cirratus]|uniref:Stability/partitioning determinant n=1 Tax=Streptomyces cirratus TaxID=68187 RepID=A0ABQ3EXN4_9ACTN|nr:hypothetical protein [Streptomyces cirratus]GHB60686.1 hypothetical protein GCM10010347_33420 [Streptomyces cirratus]